MATKNKSRAYNHSSQHILHKNIDQLPPKHVKLMIPYSKSSESNLTDKPRLNDISSQESDTQSGGNLSAEFKKWSKTHTKHVLRKAKSQNYDGTDQQHIQTQSSYYRNITNYVDDYNNNYNNYQYYQPPPMTQHQQQQQHQEERDRLHQRDRSHISQYSIVSNSESINTLNSIGHIPPHSHLSNNNISSSSEDFIKENLTNLHTQTSYDYTSPSPTQIHNNRMWQHSNNGYILNHNLSNKSKDSVSTNNSIQSIKNTLQIYHEITNNLKYKIGILQQENILSQIENMNEIMVKITLEFCGFDIENTNKFNPLYTVLEQQLKIQNLSSSMYVRYGLYYIYIYIYIYILLLLLYCYLRFCVLCLLFLLLLL